MGNTRALTDVLAYEPTMPQVHDLDAEQIVVRYNDERDSLYIFFSNPPAAAISVDLNEYRYLRVDDQTQRVVGVQIEGYLTSAVERDPRWLVWGELADIPYDKLDDAKQRIGVNRRRESALLTTFEDLVSLTTP